MREGDVRSSAVAPVSRSRSGGLRLRQALAVYVVFDVRGEGTERVARAALEAGATSLQLRTKSALGGGGVVALARRLRPITEACGALLFVNDRVDWAVAAGADGVHVGPKDEPPHRVREAARAAGRPELLVGVSVSTVAAARDVASVASYLSASPIFATPSKPDLEPPMGLAGLAALRAAFPATPLVAIGGIHASEVASVIAAGADGVAFVSAAFDGGSAVAGVRRMRHAVLRSGASPRVASEGA